MKTTTRFLLLAFAERQRRANARRLECLRSEAAALRALIQRAMFDRVANHD